MPADRLEFLGHLQLVDHFLQPAQTKTEPEVQSRRRVVTICAALRSLTTQPPETELLRANLLLRATLHRLCSQHQQLFAELEVAIVTIIKETCKLNERLGLVQLAGSEWVAWHAGSHLALRCE